MVECAIKITRKHRWRTRRGGISFFSRSPQGYRPPIISYSSFVFRPTFYFASCISCPPAARRFSHVLHTHTLTHSYTRTTYLAYAQRYSLFRSGRNVQTRRTRPTRDTCCSFLLSFLSFFLPSFLPRVCLCFEVTVIRSIARTQFTWLFR